MNECYSCKNYALGDDDVVFLPNNKCICNDCLNLGASLDGFLLSFCTQVIYFKKSLDNVIAIESSHTRDKIIDRLNYKAYRDEIESEKRTLLFKVYREMVTEIKYINENIDLFAIEIIKINILKEISDKQKLRVNDLVQAGFKAGTVRSFAKHFQIDKEKNYYVFSKKDIANLIHYSFNNKHFLDKLRFH